METEQRIAKAIEVIGQQFGRNGRPPQMVHGSVTLDIVNKTRALEGLCGRCPNLVLKFERIDGKEGVALRCSKGHSPVALYDHIRFGEEAFCRDQSKGELK